MRCRMTTLVLQISTLCLVVGLSVAFYGLTARDTYLNLVPNYRERMQDFKKARPEDYCSSLGLHRKQKRECRRGKGVAETLVRATRLSAMECQHQFQYERWNCSLGSYRKHILEKGSVCHGNQD